MYLPILFRSPPGGISKVINAAAKQERNSASPAATRRARCRTCMHFAIRVKFHPNSVRADVMLHIGIEDLEAL